MYDTPANDTVALIVQITSLSQHTDTMFMNITNQNPAKAYERPPQLVNYLDQLMASLGNNPSLKDRLFSAMIDQGNFLDIWCEMQRQQDQGITGAGYQEWQNIASKILSIQKNQTFHAKRIYIMQVPFVQKGDQSREQAIAESKNAAGLPQNVSWDTISYKIPPSASEYLCLWNPELLDILSQADISIIDQIQEKVNQIMLLTFQEHKKDFLVSAEDDQFVDDLSVLLESRISGVNDSQRRQNVTTQGDLELIKYAITTVQAFTQGIVPGTISPGKITACQDAISMVELQGTIQNLAEEQVMQAAQTMKNPAARAGIRYAGQNNSVMGMGQKWTQEQNNSITHAASITQQMIAASVGSFGSDPYEPQKEIKNQITGGANTLSEQIGMATQGEVIRLTPEEQEVLKQSLSLMLACIRIRFEATREARGELVAQEDIDHLNVIQRLSRYIDAASMQFFMETTQVLIESITNGHNAIRLLGKGPDRKAVETAFMQAQTIAEEMAKAIPLLEADLRERGRETFNEMMSAVYLALADNDRIKRERMVRLTKRKALFQAIKSYI